MNFTTIYLPQMFVLDLIEVAYGLPVAQSATSLWTVKSAFTSVVEGKARLVPVGDFKEYFNISANTLVCIFAKC